MFSTKPPKSYSLFAGGSRVTPTHPNPQIRRAFPPRCREAGAALGAVAFFTSTARCFDVLSDPLMAQAQPARRGDARGRRGSRWASGSFGAMALRCPKSMQN